MSVRNQVENFFTLDNLVGSGHQYRHLDGLLDWELLTVDIKATYSTLGRKGYSPEAAFRMLVLQFMEDL